MELGGGNMHKFILFLLVISFTTVGYGEHKDLNLKAKAQVKKLLAEVEQAKKALSEVVADYNDVDIIPRERDRRYFQRDFEDYKDKHFSGQDSLHEGLHELTRILNDTGPVNPCAGKPTKIRCDNCTYPGNQTCRTINCLGKIVDTFQRKCQLNNALFSCGTCDYVSQAGGGLDWYKYDVMYSGKQVDTVRVKSYKWYGCEDRQKADTRCHKN